MRIEYNSQGNIERIRKDVSDYIYSYWQSSSFSFHPNGEVASYFGMYSQYSTITMTQCTYDTSGNVLTSVGGSVEDRGYYGEVVMQVPPGCVNGVTIPDPTSYFVYPTPLTDDGTSHTPVELSCTP